MSKVVQFPSAVKESEVEAGAQPFRELTKEENDFLAEANAILNTDEGIAQFHKVVTWQSAISNKAMLIAEAIMETQKIDSNTAVSRSFSLGSDGAIFMVTLDTGIQNAKGQRVVKNVVVLVPPEAIYELDFNKAIELTITNARLLAERAQQLREEQEASNNGTIN